MSQAQDFAQQNFSNPIYGPAKPRKTFVLLFDGTGNKFSGEDGDSNILKILRMLDRNDSSQLHYYQPGIGTYVQSSTYSHTSVFTRFNSWLQKTRDSAVGTSFDVHVMGGYKFLMKYYETGDDIYFLGFSRGAYIARFLAEMLDYVGLLEPGNEEMARFAWKAFAQWQMRRDGTKDEAEKKKKMFKYLSAFRDTFSRPVRRIRFIGLFDTVNSVPRFENAWMQRSRFPYTAKSSAIIIRHAVGIDERRAKFRQDLISETTSPSTEKVSRGRPVKRAVADRLGVPQEGVTPHQENAMPNQRYRRKSRARRGGGSRGASPNPSPRPVPEKDGDGHSLKTQSSAISLIPPRRPGEDEGAGDDDDDDADEAIPQDIQEMWFPGCHADIGGGWPLSEGEEFPLSHGPLVWMVREARKAGLRFDVEKMAQMNCLDETNPNYDAPEDGPHIEIPTVQIDSPTHSRSQTAKDGVPKASKQDNKLRETLHKASTKGVLHDSLDFGQGYSLIGVMAWHVMEYLPFRRMDLMPDNSWRSIRWPLPMGETRDIPSNAIIHISAIRRMEANPKYRPGNLIVGGGGRGTRIAPSKYGTGEWDNYREEHDPIGECVVRKEPPEAMEKAKDAAQRSNGNAST